MESSLHWYAVYTRPCWEKKVASLFEKQEINYYCPLQKIQKTWSDRKKIIEEPLFKSYVFVRIDHKQQTRVRMVDGVVNFVHYLNKPAVIRDEEIDTVKMFLNEYSNVKLEPMVFSVNDRVKIVSGPFMEMEGSVLQVHHKTVKVLLPSMGFAMTAEVEKANIMK